MQKHSWHVVASSWYSPMNLIADSKYWRIFSDGKSRIPTRSCLHFLSWQKGKSGVALMTWEIPNCFKRVPFWASKAFPVRQRALFLIVFTSEVGCWNSWEAHGYLPTKTWGMISFIIKFSLSMGCGLEGIGGRLSWSLTISTAQSTSWGYWLFSALKPPTNDSSTLL